MTLQTHALSIGYGDKRKTVVAAGLDLQLHAGELICLLGPNGAGKSTLIRTLCGLQLAVSGRIEVGRVDTAAMPPGELARRLSVVLTDRVEVGSMKAFALAALGRHPHVNWRGALTDQDRAIVARAMDEAGATSLADRFFDELSDGERQKVLIARALAQEPELMILDEPTAFLDLPRRVELMRLLRRLAHDSGKAVLCSTHDLNLAMAAADRLWLLADGEICAGAPEDLVLDGSLAHVFESENVEFDAMLGDFRVHTPHAGKICVLGNGLPAIWAKRAAERAGYDVGAQADGIPVIECLDCGWQVGPDRFGSLHAVVGRLRETARKSSANR